jgi:hypothetical protein
MNENTNSNTTDNAESVSEQAQQMHTPEPPVTDPKLKSSPSVSAINKTGPTWMTMILVVIAVAGVTGIVVYYLMSLQISELNTKNADLTSSNKSLKEAASGEGIVTTKTTMFKVSDITDATWESDKQLDPNYSDQLIDFEAKSATRTPIVADMSAIRDSYKDKEWVAVEINATDTRTSGPKRAIILRDSIRLNDNGEIISPIDDQELLIAPLENKTVYVFFPVNKASGVFELWTGDLANPTINNLDFQNGTELSGYFLMEDGFSTKL